MVDVLLHPDYKTTAATYAHSHDPRQLKALISEAIRIAVPLGGVYREVITDVTLSTGTTYSRGDRVFVSLKDANRDVSVRSRFIYLLPNSCIPHVGLGLRKP